eukprot:TRINITY_DN6767_c0_g1_i3.p1 TRINITY_DN6767_c0_g1~~TRINITY_DN6767_c0_g1_i3.p1  ORF type:complete len:166 (-),score=51.59 TRINITY_DN6767_c0_g1_i3:379-876(-)
MCIRDSLQTALVFNPWRDRVAEMDGKLVYAEDGNLSMDNEKNSKMRTELRSHPAVEDALGRLTSLYTQVDGMIGKDEYVRNYLRIFQALQPDVPTAEAQQEAEEDWRSDSTDHNFISQQQLARSLFELADLWCKSVDVNEYLAFLDTLVPKLRGGYPVQAVQQTQ